MRDAARRALSVLREAPQIAVDPYWRYWTYSVFAMVEGLYADGLTESLDLLAQARELEDPGWPARRRYYRMYGEAFTAGSAAERIHWLRQALALDLASGGHGFLESGNLVDAELSSGDAASAVRTGESLLRDLDASRDEGTRAFACVNLCAAHLALGNVARARDIAQIAWPQSSLFGTRTVWADYLVLLAALENRPRAAAALAGYADARYAATEQPREANEAAAMERGREIARAALGDVEFERLVRSGNAMRDDEIAQIAFATDDVAA